MWSMSALPLKSVLSDLLCVKNTSPFIWLLPTKIWPLPLASTWIDSLLAIAAIASVWLLVPAAALVSRVLLPLSLAPFETVKKPTWVPAGMVPSEMVLDWE